MVAVMVEDCMLRDGGSGFICWRAVWIGAKQIKAQGEEFENSCSKSDGNFVGFIDFWQSTTPFLLLMGIQIYLR
jgi:hypothetical protein